jgi:type I protein arginine methyltransferase
MQDFQEVQTRKDKQAQKYVPRGSSAKPHDDIDMKEPGQKNSRPRRDRKPKNPQSQETTPVQSQPTNGATATQEEEKKSGPPKATPSGRGAKSGS